MRLGTILANAKAPNIVGVSFPPRNASSPRTEPPYPLGKTGGEIFHDLMIRHNVKHIFGYPGGAILPVFDAIYNSKHFQFILPRHEQGAGHMAQGYSRVTGKPGVVLVTSGPGATNLITPMMDALADGTPLVVFAGQVNTAMIGLDSFQEVDMLSMSQPCTKWNVRVRSPEELPRRVEEAFEIATRGRPGPVLVELPQDVTAGRAHERPPISLSLPSRMSPAGMAMRQMERNSLNRAIGETARLINIAKKPIIYGGQGVLATPQGPLHLKSLAEKASIPVTTSLQGLGAFDEDDPKALHMLGLHGAGYANMAMQHADLIIALGARFDDRVTGNITKFAPEANLAATQGRGGIVHFDISPKSINKVVEATVAVVGDCGSSLGLLLPHVNKAERPEWLAQIQAWKDKYPFSAYRCSGLGDQIQPQRIIERLNEMLAPIKDRTIITTGVGQHQMWAAQHFRWKYPRTMVTSGGLGTMGFGLPAAIGAKIARPDAVVIDIDGDASFNMTLSELQTASEFDIGVKVIILNNEGQGMVTHLQTVYYQNRFSQSHGLNPDFIRASEAMGVQAQCCSKLDEVDEKLKWLLEAKGPAVLEVKVARESLTLPMVPSGCGLDEFQFYSN
ncbi:thiamine diphosphate-binding protein [Aspergillus pseudodeflectus]|uniref:Acetolactate synthase n=1 Tax=Aspergillus pseudodeflectus TaxID=176178 RepID=A0ABR4JYP4_9EURO